MMMAQKSDQATVPAARGRGREALRREPPTGHGGLVRVLCGRHSHSNTVEEHGPYCGGLASGSVMLPS